MSNQDNGGPAFPHEYKFGDGTAERADGMSVRDYMAAKAMQAAATNPAGADGFTFEQRAKWAYMQADAMLAARGQQ
jgi:hypothetical protein